MKKRFPASADYLKANLNSFTEGQINDFCANWKCECPSFNEDIFKRYISGECGPNGGKIKKKRPKHMIYDGLDLSEMVEGGE